MRRGTRNLHVLLRFACGARQASMLLRSLLRSLPTPTCPCACAAHGHGCLRSPGGQTLPRPAPLAAVCCFALQGESKEAQAELALIDEYAQRRASRRSTVRPLPLAAAFVLLSVHASAVLRYLCGIAVATCIHARPPALYVPVDCWTSSWRMQCSQRACDSCRRRTTSTTTRALSSLK